MQVKLSIRDIRQSYTGLRRLAQKAFEEGDIRKSTYYIHHCSVIAQQFNWIYADNEMEQLLKQIGEKVIGGNTASIETDNKRVVLVDDFSVPFILAIQYIDALLANGREVLYITTLAGTGKHHDITPDLSTKEGVITKRIPLIGGSKDIEEKLRELHQTIVEFAPAHVLLHQSPSTMTSPVVYTLPENVKSYLINLADQTYWMGVGAIDYCIEFRPFGVTVSQERRGIKPKQQLMLPFYPVVDGNPFQGFPEECKEKGKVLIFSGGDIYKVLDEKRMYWYLVKKLLDTFPEVVFLFATKGDRFGIDFLKGFIKENHFEGRFIYTKFRPDIYQVLAHTDIYMGTCPASGSLMSQLAAINATPILQYYYPGTPDDETEQALCINEQFQISFQDEDAFMQEADRLIKNANYRKSQGVRIQKAMIQPEQFNKAVEQILTTQESPYPVTTKHVDYDMLDERWFALEAAGFIHTMPYLCSLLGEKNLIKYAPILYVKKKISVLIEYVKRFNQ